MNVQHERNCFNKGGGGSFRLERITELQWTP